MEVFFMKNTKNIILFLGKAPLEDVRDFKKKNKKAYRIALGYTEKLDKKTQKKYENVYDILIKINLKSENTILKSLQPYLDELLAATCRGDANIPHFAKVIPLLPYLRTPTVQSLMWSVDKLAMRRRFRSYNKKMTPRYKLVKNAQKKTIKEIVEKVGFPLVVKPTGLGASLLVTMCYHEEELQKTLRSVFRKIQSHYKKDYKGKEPEVIVEEFMDGDMYSIDGYVNSRGKIYFCPMAAITTGKNIGFDDFFGYKQAMPTLLKPESIKAAQLIATDAVHALGLRSSSIHVELIKSEGGWKVIEVGPRIGGFRNDLYKLSYNIDHTENDILIRIPKKPIVPKKIIGHSAAMKFFAKKEGTIKSITGIKKARELKSFHKINIHKKVGDRAVFAKNGGKSVFNIILHNKDRSKLLADIRRLEQAVKIETA
jgi:biotin carboxylase